MKEHLNPASQSRGRSWCVRATGLAALAAVILAALVLYEPALDEWRWRTVLATSGEERGEAVQRLVENGSERTIQALLRRMRRELEAPENPVPDAWPRCEFRGGLPEECLAQFGVRALPVLLKVLEEDHDPEMRLACREVISGMSGRPSWGSRKSTGRDGLPAILGVLARNPPPRTRDCLFHLLAHPLATGEAVSIVASFLDNPDPQAQEDAAWVLASMGPDARAAAPALQQLHERGPAEPVRSMVTRALDSLQGILDCREGDLPHSTFGEDLKKREPRRRRQTCGVHGATLQEDVVPIRYGLIRHRPEAVKARESRFPEANGYVEGGCVDLPWDRARVLFCAACRKEEAEYRRAVAGTK